MQNKFESIPTHNFKKFKSAKTKFSFIKVRRINSKEINTTNNLDAESLEKSLKNTKIVLKSNNKNRTSSNIKLRKKKQSPQKKSTVKIKLKNKPKKFYNNSAIVKSSNINEVENHFEPSFFSSPKYSKKIGPNSPICHLYYGYKNSSMSENLDDIFKKQNNSFFYPVPNNKSLSNKSKKNNNTGSTALSYNESCISNPISPFKNYSVGVGIPNQFDFNFFDDLKSSSNKNVNLNKENKITMTYFKELDINKIKDYSENKIFLNKKEDTSLLTFGNSINESGNNSLRGYFNNNNYKEEKIKNDTKKCISILQKENETLKYQLNQKNEKINSLQQKIEQLLLNEKENINFIQNTHLKAKEKKCPLPTPYVRKYSQNEFNVSTVIKQNKKIFPSSSKSKNINLKNKGGTKINNSFGKFTKNGKYAFSSPNTTRKFIRKINTNDSKLIYTNQIRNKK